MPRRSMRKRNSSPMRKRGSGRKGSHRRPSRKGSRRRSMRKRGSGRRRYYRSASSNETLPALIQALRPITGTGTGLKSTTWKIRGPLTNQPEKVGSQESGLIDWVMSNLPGTVINSFNPEGNVAHLLPQYPQNGPTNQKINFEDPKNHQSTSDHMPVIVKFENGVKLFQMNLLANLLSGDGFLMGDSSINKALLTDLKVLKTYVTNNFDTLFPEKNESDEQKRSRKANRKRAIKDFVAGTYLVNKQVWDEKRDEFMIGKEYNMEEIRRLSITKSSLTPALFQKRLNVWVRSILNEDYEKPDILTLQENDMYKMLDKDKNFTKVYTCKDKHDNEAIQLKLDSNGPRELPHGILIEWATKFKNVCDYNLNDGVSIYVNKDTCTIKEIHKGRAGMNLPEKDKAPFVMARIKKNDVDEEMWVITTHLSSGAEKVDERVTQLTGLIDEINRVCLGANVILAMDANANLQSNQKYSTLFPHLIGSTGGMGA